jgi:predicted DNA-binding transcriptional regulator AlpA
MADSEETTEFWTIREAAQKSGLALTTWYGGGAGTASLPRVRFGRSIRLRRKDVEQFIRKRIAEAEQSVERSVKEESQ